MNFMSESSPWQWIRSREVYDNPRIRVRVDKRINSSGSKSLYGYIRFKNHAFGVIPLSTSGWRQTFYREMWYPLKRVHFISF